MRSHVVMVVLLWFGGIRPAAAHTSESLQPATLWHAWNFDPLVLVPLLLAVVLYALGLRQLWTRVGSARGVARPHVAAFSLGVIALFVALVSPLDVLGGELLSAHMAQHALLVTVAPVSLLSGKPAVVLAWALPAPSRRRLLHSRTWRALVALMGELSRPLPSAFLHGLAIWGWHAPRAFNAALESYGVHMLEHSCFFGTALLFWSAMLHPRSARRAAPALGAAFVTLMHGGLLGGLITTAPFPLYAWYRDRTSLWGLTALEDQQLAGLIMWIPMGVFYLAACLVLATRFLHAGQPSREPSAPRLD